MSITAAMLGTATETPRLASYVTSPSLVSDRNASRKVLRDTPSRSAIPASDRR